MSAPPRRAFPADLLAQETVRLVSWDDGPIDHHGLPVSSEECEMTWLPILAPVSWTMLRHLDRLLGDQQAVTTTQEDIALAIGVGNEKQHVRRAFKRLWRMGMIGQLDGSFKVRRTLMRPRMPRPRQMSGGVRNGDRRS